MNLSKKTIVETIAQKKKSTISPDLINALELLSKDLYEDDTHFIYELLQNAQDNYYEEGVSPSIKFELFDKDPTETPGSEGCLCVYNNEVGFSEENIFSICSVSQSTKKAKKAEGFVGEKGIGFKSIFKVTENPKIYSNGFQFELKERDEKLNGIGYIIPYWIDNIPEFVDKDITAIFLPLKKGKYQKVFDDLSKFKPTTFLFLDKIDKLEISLNGQNSKFIKKRRGADLLIEVLVNGEVLAVEKYKFFQKKVRVPDSINEEKRVGVTSRTLSVAFPLDGTNPEFTVFSYLPTSMQTSLPFVINSDFLMVSSREKINDSQWNHWILNQLALFIAETLKEEIRSKIEGPSEFYLYIPIKDDLNNKHITSLVERIIEELRGDEIILATDGGFRVASDIYHLEKSFRNLFLNCDVSPHKISWVHESLQKKFVKQLKELGVKALNKAQKLFYLEKSEWIEQQDAAWFLSLFRYLSEKEPSILSKAEEELCLFPSNIGGLKVANTIFLKPAQSKGNILKIPQNTLFPQANFLREDVFEVLQNDKVLFEEIKGALNLRSFSVVNYVYTQLIPRLEENLNKFNHAEVQEKEELAVFIVENIHELSDEDNEELWDITSDLPVLDESGNLSFGYDEARDEVSYLTRQNEEKWKSLFSKEEVEHLSILHSVYSALDEEKLAHFFNEIEALSWPAPKVVQINSASRLTGLYEDYFTYLKNEFLHNYSINSTTPKSVSMTLLPICFPNDVIKNQEIKLIFIEWLEFVQDRYNISSAIGKYFYFTQKRKYLKDAFHYILMNRPWLSTTKGLKSPRECFVDDKNLRLVLGDSVAYLQDKLSPELTDLLEISKDASIDTLITQLQNFSGNSSIDIKSVLPLYKAIQQQFDLDECEVFKTEKLIAVPRGEKTVWFSLSEVVWQNLSSLGDEFPIVGLESHYSSLRSFFVDSLEVSEFLEPSQYAELWLSMQDSQKTKDELNSALNFIYRNIRKEIERDPSQDWLIDFKSKAKVYTRRGSWVSSSSSTLFFADEESIARKLQDANFVFRPDSQSLDEVAVISDFLGVKRLTQVAEYKICNTNNIKASNEKKYLPESSVWAICYALRGVIEEEELLDIVSSEKIISLVNINEAVLNQLELEVKVNHFPAIFIKKELYIDYSMPHLYMDSGTDEEDIKDSLSAELIHILSNHRLPRNFKDTVRKCLAITPSRLESLKKKERWSLTPEVNRQLKKLFDNKANTHDALQPQVEAGESSENLEVNLPEHIGESTNSSNPINDKEGDFQTSANGVKESKDQIHLKKNNDSNTGFTRQHNSSSQQFQSIQRDEVSAYGAENNSFVSQSSGQKNDHLSRTSSFNKSRSNSLAKTINTAVRNKLRSYVQNEQSSESEDYREPDESIPARKEMGDRAELFVLNDLQRKGYLAKRMPENNAGFDIQAVDKLNGEIFLVEVKGDSFAWGDKGVGISKIQYEYARENQSSYYLAVVENVRTDNPRIHYIQNPAMQITEYRFDQGWKGIARDIPTIGQKTETEKSSDSYQQLLDLTDDEVCKSIIEFCKTENLPFPEVGVEITGSRGEVIVGDVELGWEEEKVLVFVDEDAFIEFAELEWQAYFAPELKNDFSQIKSDLEERNLSE